jgi:Zn-finger nucleic acid-binding protein
MFDITTTKICPICKRKYKSKPEIGSVTFPVCPKCRILPLPKKSKKDKM